jgi:serine protease Do
MSRRREWVKFGALVGAALALAVALVSAMDIPAATFAQQPSGTVIVDRPAPVEAAQPVVDLGEAFAAVADAVRPAVVYIEAAASSREPQERAPAPSPFDRFFDMPEQPRPRRGTGSGFLISADGYIVTNNHVVDGFDRFDVTLFDGRTFEAEVVGGDGDTDVAIIKIDARDLASVSLGDSDDLRVGEWVLAIGNPLGEAFTFTVTAGIVSGRGRGLAGLNNSRWNIQDFIQTDAAINPGNSGGPLVNINGQVVGVNSAIASRTGFYSGYSFAIPINLARIVSEQLIEHGRVTRAALGITIVDATQEDAEFVGLEEVRGVMINDYSGDDSPARQAGLEPGDVIIEVDGHRVDYVAQLQQMVGFKRPGDRITVTVMRQGGARHEIVVVLGEADTREAPEVASLDRSEPGETASYQSKLGLEIEAFPSELMSGESGIARESHGPIIVDVDPDGPARGKGLAPASPRQGVLDIITHVNDERVQTVEDLGRALGSVAAGSIVSLRVYQVRRGQTGSRVVRMRAAN